MSHEEFREIEDYDAYFHSDAEIDQAFTWAKMDAAKWSKGMPKPHPGRYLRKLKRKPRTKPETIAEVRDRLNRQLGIAGPSPPDPTPTGASADGEQ